MLATNFTQGASFCLIDHLHLLCVGGCPSSNLVYELTTNTQQLVPLPLLNAARGYAGVVKVGAFVYAFGSLNPNLASCEKFSLADQAWLNLPEMNAARGFFQPAVFNTDIYVAGTYGGSQSIQVLNVVTDTFTTLSIEIPPQVPIAAATGFVVDRKLYLLFDTGQIGKWKIGENPPMTVTSSTGGNWSNTAAFVQGSEVWLVPYNTGALVKFNYRTKSLVS